MNIKQATSVTIVILMIFAACDDDNDPAGPTMADVAGQYTAITLTLTQDGQETDLLAGGGELVITLATDGTTSGRVFLPGAGEDGGDMEASLDGTWTLSGQTVTFDQPDSDTFVEGRPFLVDGDLLRSENEGVVEIVLQKGE